MIPRAIGRQEDHELPAVVFAGAVLPVLPVLPRRTRTPVGAA
ncbi:hypothetical protein ACFQ6B_25595 [Streptomyces wedmorensis]